MPPGSASPVPAAVTPSATASPALAAEVDPAGLPPGLRALLRDEGHVRLGLALLLEAEEAAGHDLRETARRITPLDRLLTVARRPRPVMVECRERADHLARLRRTRALLERLAASLGTEAEDAMEAYVRAHVPAYLRGLAALENLGDWTRALERFRQQLVAFRRAVGQARGAATSGYQKSANRVSDNAYDRLADAQLAADALEAEIAFVNRLSALHREMVRSTPCAEVFIPTVPVSPYAAWIGQLPTLAIGPLQLEFARILKAVDVLEADGMRDLAAAVQRSRENHLELAHSFVLTVLAQVRAHAEATWVEPAQTNATLQRLERDLLGSDALEFEFEAA